MTCRLRWYGLNQNQKQNSNMADVLGNAMACHPRPTCHIAAWKNSIRYIENSFSPYFIFFCFLNVVWSLASGGFRIVSDTLLLRVSCILCLFVVCLWVDGLAVIGQITRYGQNRTYNRILYIMNSMLKYAINYIIYIFIFISFNTDVTN